MKVCKNCGEINSNDVQFCPNCGGKAFVFQEERTCPHCGAANDKSFVYCISCGQKLFSEAVSVEEVAPSAQILPGEEGFVPTPVDVRELHSDVYAGGAPSIPHETARCPRVRSQRAHTRHFLPEMRHSGGKPARAQGGQQKGVPPLRQV